jgi:hypothetical protein
MCQVGAGRTADRPFARETLAIFGDGYEIPIGIKAAAPGVKDPFEAMKPVFVEIIAFEPLD